MLEDNQIGTYEGNAPTHCAISGAYLTGGRNQYAIDSEHYVLVSSSNVRHVTYDTREAWRQQFTTSSKRSSKTSEKDNE